MSDNNFPIIDLNNKKVISEETAYQMTSILTGSSQKRDRKKIKNLKVYILAGKTEQPIIIMMHGL